MLDAEGKSKKSLDRIVTREDLEAKDREGLCDQRSVEIYFMWRAFGGMAPQLSLTEILSMPSWLRRDFLYLNRFIHEMRDDREGSQAFFEAAKPKRIKSPRKRAH